MIPKTDTGFDLGSSTKRWDRIHASEINTEVISGSLTGSFGRVFAAGDIYAQGEVSADSFVSRGGGGTISFQDDVAFGSDDSITSIQNITATGNISSSLSSTGSFGHLHIADRVGIGITDPSSILHISGTDGLIIPVGNTSQRSSDAKQGEIRFNAQLQTYEGYDGNNWGTLGGMTDVDQDTKITAETSAGADNDELKFFTAGSERLRIFADGHISASGDITGSGNLEIKGRGKFSDLQVTDDMTVTDDVGIGGVLTATGGTILGNASSDTHRITGSLNVTSDNLTVEGDGSVSGSTTSTGSFGLIEIAGIDINPSGIARDQVLKFNGTNFVAANPDDTFVFTIADFDTNDGSTPQLIGTGSWKAPGALTFTATYNNGPPDGHSGGSEGAPKITSIIDGVTSGSDMFPLSSSFSTGTNNRAIPVSYTHLTLPTNREV